MRGRLPTTFNGTETLRHQVGNVTTRFVTCDLSHGEDCCGLPITALRTLSSELWLGDRHGVPSCLRPADQVIPRLCRCHVQGFCKVTFGERDCKTIFDATSYSKLANFVNCHAWYLVHQGSFLNDTDGHRPNYCLIEFYFTSSLSDRTRASPPAIHGNLSRQLMDTTRYPISSNAHQ